MKKAIRLISAMMAIMLLMAFATLPALAAGFDFESAIPSFSADAFNTIQLKPGETHTPNSAIFAQNGVAACYSSDQAVVTVSEQGVVTAVGEGVAYVAYDTGSELTTTLYQYTVAAPIEPEAPEAVAPIEPESPSAVIPAPEPETNPELEKEEDPFTEQRQEIEQEMEEMKNEGKKIRERSQWIFKVVPIIFGIAILAVVIIVVLLTRHMKKSSGSTKNTITCPTCSGIHPVGTEICPICGRKL